MSSGSLDNVALFSTRFLPYSQTFIHDEIRSHSRYDVDVFCKTRENPDRFPFDDVHKPPSWAEWLYENLGYWPAFDRRISHGRYALLHAHFGTGAVYALPYAKRHDLPLVVTFWGNDVSALVGSQRFNPFRWRYVLFSRFIFRHADLMLGVSNELCTLLAELSGRPEAVKYWTHGVDLERFRPRDVPRPESIPRLIMVGRFTEKKGHTYALQAFRKVVDDGVRAELVFVGSGEEEPWCRRYVEMHGLSDYVTFAGVLSQEETAAQIVRADIALVPSVVARNHDREGSPTVAKEAAACGIPLIATWHAGLPEIIEDGKTGYLLQERDVSGLADRMRRLIADPELRDRFGAAARRKMEAEFDLRKKVHELEHHYDSVR
ncbi:MAG: glycosyltransferase [Rhodothermales bacterium]|nr:glycosyltransferase [Rhodothermales bacterium]